MENMLVLRMWKSVNDLEKNLHIAFTGGECFPNKCGVIVENIDNNQDEMTIGQFFSTNK